jgi:hypothetical protein
MTDDDKKPKKSRSRDDILALKPRCIYCANEATTVEHMPPLSMFKRKDRPSGLEFPSCQTCNNVTSAADAAAVFYSRIGWLNDDLDSWQLRDMERQIKTLDSLVPEFRKEFSTTKEGEVLKRTPGGIFVKKVQLNCDGPVSQALLSAFSAKLGMAFFAEHTGKPMPLDGGVHGMWFLNSGLSQKAADTMLKMLPMFETLKQGERKTATGQFDYRFNSDDKSIVAALTHFHSNIHFFTIAMANPADYKFPRQDIHGAFVKPGQLVDFMPKPRPFIFI